MPSAISRVNKNKRSRRLSGQQRPLGRAIPIGVSTITKSGSTLTVTFDQPVSLSGTPKYTTSISGVTAISAVASNATTIVVTFSAAVTTATTMTVPFEDGAVRNSSGGYVSAGTFPVS